MASVERVAPGGAPASAAARPPAVSGPNSAVKSVPRRDWPCRFVNAIGGTTIATSWEYGKRTECHIPADLVGSRGMVGCPDRLVHQNLENMVEMPERHVDDDTNHLVEVQTLAAKFQYTWNGDLVVSRTIGGEPARFEGHGSSASIKDQNGESEVIDFDSNGRAARFTRGESVKTFGWKGSRLTRRHGFGTTRVEYDCKRPPRR
jgi:hypothetical protein